MWKPTEHQVTSYFPLKTFPQNLLNPVVTPQFHLSLVTPRSHFQDVIFTCTILNFTSYQHASPLITRIWGGHASNLYSEYWEVSKSLILTYQILRTTCEIKSKLKKGCLTIDWHFIRVTREVGRSRLNWGDFERKKLPQQEKNSTRRRSCYLFSSLQICDWTELRFNSRIFSISTNHDWWVMNTAATTP